MTEVPLDFVPDLRRLQIYPAMQSSLWRHYYLADLTYGALFRLIKRFVPSRKLSILDLGCGWGSISLELAREGHNVLGIDRDEEVIKIAKRGNGPENLRQKQGTLEYQVADFSSWKNQGIEFDVALLSRVLHHIPQPDRVLAKVKQLLSSKGRIICVDYAYDRFDRQSATWFYHIRSLLERAGWFKSEKPLTDNIEESVKQILDEWHGPARKEYFNKFEQLYGPLREMFIASHFSWEPYIFWDILRDLQISSADTLIAMAHAVSSMEALSIDRKTVSPILFCFVGDVSQTDNLLELPTPLRSDT